MDAETTAKAATPLQPRARTGADRHSIQSVDRALLLLETIAECGGEATLTELSNRTKLNISTCHHLLATLIMRGFAAKVPGRRLYALGARILYLGHACLQVDLPRRATPFVDHVSRVTGETVHLAALQGEAIVTLLLRDSRHAVRVDAGSAGKTEAAHATAIGKAMLAWLPEDEMRRILGGGMRRFTSQTITEFPELIEDLRLVRRKGFAIDREEFQPGVICIGAAIRDHAGTVVGAISASTPSMRASDDHIELMRSEVMTAARGLSAEFGAQTERPQAAE
jgi:IclR family acetate operon transcriptional repressor